MPFEAVGGLRQRGEIARRQFIIQPLNIIWYRVSKQRVIAAGMQFGVTFVPGRGWLLLFLSKLLLNQLQDSFLQRSADIKVYAELTRPIL